MCPSKLSHGVKGRDFLFFENKEYKFYWASNLILKKAFIELMKKGVVFFLSEIKHLIRKEGGAIPPLLKRSQCLL